MRRLLAVLALAAGAVALPAAAAGASPPEPVLTDPSLTIEPSSGPPGFQFQMTVTDCMDDEPVRLQYVSGSLVFVDTTCDDGTASAVLTAPDVAGTFEASARVGDATDIFVSDPCAEDLTRPCRVLSEFTVLPLDLTVEPSSGEPGFEFTMRLDNCGAQYFELDSLSTSEVGLGQDVVFVLPETGQDEDAFCSQPTGTVTSGTFTAPSEPGTYPVYAFLPDPGRVELSLTQDALPTDCATVEDPFGCGVFGEITVTAADTTTTTDPPPATTAPTTVPPDTTAPPTTAPTTPATTAVPTDPTAPPADDADAVPPAPVVELPATGSSGPGGAGALALLVLVLGAAFVLLARRSTVGD